MLILTLNGSTSTDDGLICAPLPSIYVFSLATYLLH